jgi:hypothetical protein
MKPRQVEVTLGFFLVSAILTGTATQEIPLDFFINQETGEPNVLIIVGTTAASEDVISATKLAAVIGSMCTGEYITFGERFKAVHENINTLLDSYESLGFSTSDVPDAQLYRNWERNNLPLTYTLQSLWYFNSSTFWSCDYERFQPWETHEEIQIRFDLNKTSNPCVPCLYNEDTIYTNPIDSLDLSNFCRVPGLIYRADNIFAPPSVSIRYWPLGFGLAYSRPQILYVPEPWMVTQGFLPKFKLFDTIYTVVDAGPVLDMNGRTSETGALHETPYIVTGEPHFAKHILYLGNSLEFGSYTVKLVEVDLTLSRANIEIYRDEEVQESFWTRADPLYGFVNLQDGFPFKFYRECNVVNDELERVFMESEKVEGLAAGESVTLKFQWKTKYSGKYVVHALADIRDTGKVGFI